MDRKKRAFLQVMAPLAIAAPMGIFAHRTSARQSWQSDGQPHPSSQRPGEIPPDFEPPAIDPKAVLKHNQQQIQDDIQKLYALAGELKEQVEKTDSTNVLSLPLVKKAKEIEDLAKQIRNLVLD
ncbi:MAG: hypothetical protein ACLQMT_09755 [Candidatus Acidiferrales bacterium]